MKELRNLQTRWILRVDQIQTCGMCGSTRRVKGGREKIRGPWPNGTGVNHRTCPHEWGELIGHVELKEFPYWQEDYGAFLGAKKLWEWEHLKTLKEIGYI